MARSANPVEREPFTVRVLPETRDRIRRWAFETNTHAGSVIDRLTAEYQDPLDEKQPA